MDQLQHHLKAEQAKIASRLERQVADLKPSDPDFEKKAEQLNVALDRLGDFHFQLLGQIQCPVCWLWRGVHNFLQRERFVLGANVLTCPSCKYDLKLPV